jgi:hypothetical protein
MRIHFQRLRPFLLALAVCGVAPAAGRADFITTGAGPLGRFSLSLSYAAASPTSAQLTMVLDNTTPQSLGGYLTGFVFNNPDGLIRQAALSSSNANFSLLGGPSYDNGVNGAPYGRFDLGASTFKSFEGGGNPARGIAAGGTASFVFTLKGVGLDGLAAESFATAWSVPPGDGQGDEFFVARFRGFTNGGSDKVPAHAPEPGGGVVAGGHAPEPAAGALAGMGVLGLLVLGRRRLGRPAKPAGR